MQDRALFRAMLAGFALSTAAMASQATTVELHADIFVHTYETGQLLNGLAVYEGVQGFVPQHLDFTARFELEDPYTQESELAVIPTVRSAESWFNVAQGESISTTPFSASMRMLLPSTPSSFPEMSTAYVMQSIPVTETPSAQVSIQGGFATAQVWYHEQMTTYARGINFQELGGVVPSDTVHAMTGAAFVSYLQAHVGQAGFATFQEYVSYIPTGETQYPLFVDAVHAKGDVTILSVAIVPEPATYALMGLGLVGIACAARRRQA